MLQRKVAFVSGAGAHLAGRLHLDRVIELTGQLDAEDRERLLNIADRCPVHRTLSGVVDIASRLAD